jgi:dTDP-4-dehydrorhamnose reductase
MRVLVTGASGLLGGRLAQLLAARFDVVAAFHHAPPPGGLARVALDIESSPSVAEAFAATKPDAVLHAAAYAFVDLCERDPDKARAINVEGSARVARACADSGARLVAVSTDLVFAGQTAWANEDAPAAPVMTYGRTKLEAEDVCLKTCPRAAVARVPLIIGGGFGTRGSATEAITWALRARRPVTLFTDQYRTPADAESIVPALAALLTGDQGGRFHLAGPERISRYDLGLRVARVHGLPTDAIEAISQNARADAAPRPADVSLDSSRAQRELGYVPRSLEEMIAGDRPAGD